MIVRGGCLALTLLALAAGAPRADAGEDSPWPEGDSTSPQLQAVRAVVRELERKVALMELSAARYAGWEACIRGVPVSERGDPDRQFGFAYDERDGTGLAPMPALVVDRKRRAGRKDYLFLDFARDAACRSNAPIPGGTADASRAKATSATNDSLAGLERRAARLGRSARRLLAASERFDTWVSCVSWVPVTEYGDPDGSFGYRFGRAGETSLTYRSALAVDRSDWDDPDYYFLAFVGDDRPGRTCQDEPGEADD